MRMVSLLPLIAGIATTAVPAEGQVARPQFGIATGLAFPAGQFHSSSLRGEGFGLGLQWMAFALFKVDRIPPWLLLEASYGSHWANDVLKSDLQIATGATSDEHV